MICNVCNVTKQIVFFSENVATSHVHSYSIQTHHLSEVYHWSVNPGWIKTRLTGILLKLSHSVATVKSCIYSMCNRLWLWRSQQENTVNKFMQATTHSIKGKGVYQEGAFRVTGVCPAPLQISTRPSQVSTQNTLLSNKRCIVWILVTCHCNCDVGIGLDRNPHSAPGKALPKLPKRKDSLSLVCFSCHATFWYYLSLQVYPHIGYKLRLQLYFL